MAIICNLRFLQIYIIYVLHFAVMQTLTRCIYHNMKGKKEDDNSKPKSTNESTRVNHFADLLVHVELEQLSNCSRFQPKPVKEEGRA